MSHSITYLNLPTPEDLLKGKYFKTLFTTLSVTKEKLKLIFVSPIARVIKEILIPELLAYICIIFIRRIGSLHVHNNYTLHHAFWG